MIWPYIVYFLISTIIFILYYIPVSRLWLLKTTHSLAESIACSLKVTLNNIDNFDHQNEVGHFGKPLKKCEIGKVKKNDAKKRKEWPTIQIYPPYQKDSDTSMKWDKFIHKRSSETLNVDHDDLITNYDPFLSNFSPERRKRKQVSYQDDKSTIKLREKLKKLNRHIESISMIPDKNYKEKQERETIRLIQDILRTAKLKSIKKLPQLDDQLEEDTDMFWMNDQFVTSPRDSRKPTSAAKKETPSDKPNLASVRKAESDSNDSLSPPLIVDRVSPILQKSYRWLFGGCPSS